MQEKESIPIKEETQFNPITPYAVSKIAADYLCKYYSDSMELDVVRIRPFNHTGPYRGERFVLSNWCKQVAEIEKGLKDKIRAGNIGNIRDFSDVRDVVKAYVDLITAKNLGYNLYNICSGDGKSGKDILKILCEVMDINFEKLKIEVNKSLIRPNDPPKIIGDNSRIKKDTGWEPRIPIQKTVSDIVKPL